MFSNCFVDNRRKQQSKCLPEELVKDFSVVLIKNGKIVAEKVVMGNIQRLCHVEFEKTVCDSVKIIFKNTHGCTEIRIFEVRIK